MENDNLPKNEETNLVSEETNTVVSISQENENENGDVENTKKAEKVTKDKKSKGEVVISDTVTITKKSDSNKSKKMK